jgi:membrane-associated phospholipid phosphatase
MINALVVLLWPAGLVAIPVATALLARRAGHPTTAANAPMNGHRDGEPLVGPRSARSSIVGLLLILAAGSIVVYALVALLGMLVVHAGPSIDKPIYTWMIHHRVHFWTSAMDRVTKVGDPWITWAAAAAAGVCLAAFYRRNKWLPPVTLGAAIVIDHYATLALRYTFHRLGPPDSPLGTFPAGGCARIIVLYGLIAYLIWRETSGTRRMAIWSAGAIAWLTFSEAYSRAYLTLHWSTDIISGILYGALILAVFIATIRLVDGPARKVVAEMPGRHEPHTQSARTPQ